MTVPRLFAALLAACMLVPNLARAQDWPNRPVTIVVPFAPGGATHIVGRLVAEELRQRYAARVQLGGEPGAAGERLGFPPNRCVVFEDAHVGIEAARAAGMKVIAVTTTHPREELTKADLVVERLDELTVEQVGGISEKN